MCQFVIKLTSNEIQASTEPLSTISIASSKDAENLEAMNHAFNANMQFG